MRATVELPEALFQEVGVRAASEGVPLREFIEQSLRRALAEPAAAGRRRLTFPLHRSAHPGVLRSEVVRSAEDAAAGLEDTILANLV